MKLARFKAGAEENSEKLANVQSQQAAPKVHVNQDELRKELSQNPGASAGHRRTISSGVQNAPKAEKKWWEFWK